MCVFDQNGHSMDCIIIYMTIAHTTLLHCIFITDMKRVFLLFSISVILLLSACTYKESDYECPVELKLRDCLSSSSEESRVIPSVYEWNYVKNGEKKHEEYRNEEEEPTIITIPAYDPRIVSFAYAYYIEIEPDNMILYYKNKITDEWKACDSSLIQPFERDARRGIIEIKPGVFYRVEFVWNRNAFSDRGFWGKADYVFFAAH